MQGFMLSPPAPNHRNDCAGVSRWSVSEAHQHISRFAKRVAETSALDMDIWWEEKVDWEPTLRQQSARVFSCARNCLSKVWAGNSLARRSTRSRFRTSSSARTWAGLTSYTTNDAWCASCFFGEQQPTASSPHSRHPEAPDLRLGSEHAMKGRRRCRAEENSEQRLRGLCRKDPFLAADAKLHACTFSNCQSNTAKP